MEGSGKVRRFFSAFPKEAAEDTPAIRRKAPRNVSLIFIRFFRSAGALPAESLLCEDSRPRPSPERSSILRSQLAVNKKSPAAAEPSYAQSQSKLQWSKHEAEIS